MAGKADGKGAFSTQTDGSIVVREEVVHTLGERG